jgi:hypothetical protein
MLATVPEDAARSVAQSTIAPALTRHVTHYRGKVVGSGALKLSMLHPKLKLTVAAAGATGRGALLAFAGALQAARRESLFVLFILCSSSMQLIFPSDHLTAYSPSAPVALGLGGSVSQRLGQRYLPKLNGPSSHS